LTDSEKRVARWLESNMDQMAFKPAVFISQQCQVSESTVVRFARKLGYDSYPDMQSQVQNSVQQQLSLRQKLQKSRKSTTTDQVLNQVFTTDQENLRLSMQTLSPVDFQEAVRRLVVADHVGIVGLRASGGPASLLSFSLNLIRPRVRMIPNISGDLHDHLLDFGPRDAVILISLAKPARKTLEAADYCNQRGVPTIGITDYHYAPLAPYTDLCLKVSAQGVFWESYTAVLMLCNALITAVGLATPDAAESRLKLLEEVNTIAYNKKEEDLL
jgi:DNA-binding MurR/RpiR family transcriptional regulator